MGNQTNPSPYTSVLSAVEVVDADTAFAVGAGGTVVESSDSGDTWKRITVPTTAGLADVFFLDSSHGWAVGDGGIILATLDGGDTWARQVSGTGNSLTDVFFVDAKYGWAVVPVVSACLQPMAARPGGIVTPAP